MAIAVGSHSTYDEPIATGGNREDLSDVIKDVSPTDTPVLTMIGTTKATATNHEYLIDALAAAAANKHLEGGDMTGVDPSSRTREGNYTQILSKNAVVPGTQEAVLKGGGIKSEMAYQMSRRMKEMKRDLELTIVGMSNAKVAGDETTEREMGSLDSYVHTNISLAASGSSVPAGNGAAPSDYAGTNRALTETILRASLQALYIASGGNSSVNMVVPAATKTLISTFTGSSTRYATTENKELVNSIDVYVGDFHTVRIVPDRYCLTGLSYIIDPEYLKLANLRPIHSFDIAKLGDSTRKQIVWETTLEVCNEKAHALIGDLTT